MKCPLKFARYEFEGGTDCIGAECGFYGSVCGETNGICDETNGIRAGAPLVDGDAVAILRRPISDFTDLGRAIGVLGDDEPAGGSGDRIYILGRLADMVERDYVRKDDYDFMADALKYMKAERDELKKDLSIANAKLVGKPECEICDRATLLVEIEKLRAERDERKANIKTLAGYSKYWRGRCAKLEYRSDKRAAAVERLRKMQHVDDYGDWVEAVAEVVKGTDRSNIGDYGMWESLIDLLTDDDGVARSNDGVTNLEWLFENDYETLCDQMGGQPCSCCVVGCKEDLGSDEACAKALHDWLMEPHEDAHSKAQSKTEQLLTEQSESSSDESDSRKKLEADVHAIANNTYWENMVLEWLDRQAAIDRKEFQSILEEIQACMRNGSR